MDEYPKYTSYENAMERCLKSFETVACWSDLCPVLNQLQKILEANSECKTIPKKYLVSKRLAQSTRPGWPNTVYSRALQVYDIIFKIIGPDQLVRDLFLYSHGLFQLIEHSGVIIKPALLNIFKQHFIPLRERLRPALQGFLCCIFLGYEDETSLKKNLTSLLESTCEAVTPVHFYGSLWSCVVSFPAIRRVATDFVVNHFDKGLKIEDQLDLLGSDHVIAVRAICASLSGDNFGGGCGTGSGVTVGASASSSEADVKKITFRLLILLFPMHYKHTTLTEEERVKIVTTATSAICDGNLERFFDTWLNSKTDEEDEEEEDDEGVSRKPSKMLQPPEHVRSDSVNYEDESCYFNVFSRTSLTKAFRKILKAKADRRGNVDVTPSRYRLLSKLSEKSWLKNFITKDVMIDILRSIYMDYQLVANDTENKMKFIQMVSAYFFSGLSHGYLWHFCGREFKKAANLKSRINQNDGCPVNEVGYGDTTVIEMSALLDHLLDIVIGNQDEFMPELFRQIVHVLDHRCDQLKNDELLASLRLCQKLWIRIRKYCKDSNTVVDVAVVSESVQIFTTFMTNLFRCRVFDNMDPCDVLDKLKHQNQDKFDDCTEDQVKDKKVIRDVLTEVEQVAQVQLRIRDGVHRLSDAFVCLYEILDQLIIPHNCHNPKGNESAELTIAEESEKQLNTETQDISKSPSWFQYLLLVSSMLGPSHADLMLHSVSSVFRLINNVHSNANKPSETFNLIISLGHVNAAMNQTLIFYVITHKLWNGLEQMSAMYHQRCVDLLHQLINLPNAPSHIERVISRSLTLKGKSLGEGQTFGAYQRFTLFWHLSRNFIIKRAASDANDASDTKDKKIVKMFDHCLRLMLDNLNNSSGPLKALTETWLTRAISKGDLALILEPLLLSLLDPSTARISVLHANFSLQNIVDVDVSSGSRLLHKVFAITNEIGETVHHVTNCAIGSNDKWHESQSCYSSMISDEDSGISSEVARRKFALRTFTKSLRKKKFGGKSFERSKKSKEFNISNFPFVVNPFSLMPPESKDFDKFTEGYRSASLPTSSGRGRKLSLSASSSSSSLSTSSALTASVSDSLSSLKADESRRNSLDQASAKSQQRLASSDIRAFIGQILESVMDAAILRANRDSSFDTDDGFFQMMTGYQHEEGSGNTKVTGPLTPLQNNASIPQLHTHLLLYTKVCDSKQILFSLRCVRNLLMTNPRQSIDKLASTNLSSITTARKNQLQILCARHRKSVLGKSFHGPLTAENLAPVRNTSLLEVILSTMLYYLRSYYPNLAHANVQEEILGNREVQLISIHILIALVNELALLVREKGRSFANLICDIFQRCKVHKVVLHSLLSCVNGMQTTSKPTSSNISFTEDILYFNEIQADGKETNTSEKISNYSEAFQILMLRLLLQLIHLEQNVIQQKGESPSDSRSSLASSTTLIGRFLDSKVIPEQPMFLQAIKSALSQDCNRHLHSHWTSLVTSCLPFLGRSLTQTVADTVSQLCENLERLSVIYDCDDSDKLAEMGPIPADYIVSQLDALTVIYHYCLGEPYTQVNLAFMSSQSNQTSGPMSSASSEILSNLRDVFLSSFDQKSLANSSNASEGGVVDARKKLLTKLPRMISCCVTLYRAIQNVGSSKNEAKCLLVGDPQTVQNQLLSFLSPIGLNHPIPFVSAVAVTWQDIRMASSGSSGTPAASDRILPPCSNEQDTIVELVSRISNLPISSLLQHIRQVLKTPVILEGGLSINVSTSVLQFLYYYLKKCQPNKVLRAWQNLSHLLRDCLPLSPPSIFLAMAILSQFCSLHVTLQKPENEELGSGNLSIDGSSSSFTSSPNVKFDRKDYKDLQDLSTKLIEECARIAGSYLEQPSWLRRGLVVRSELQSETVALSLSACDLTVGDIEVGTDVIGEGAVHAVDDVIGTATTDAKRLPLHYYAVPALTILSELVASILEMSHEKEKAVPVLSSILQNVLPYLRCHTRANRACFCAASKLLASISSYQSMRKAWSKDAKELLLDAAFFQMDLQSLRYWKTTIDFLMAQDNKAFSEFFDKVVNSGNGFFGTKEMEQRSMLLKRLSFVILCSDKDQYEKYAKNLQELMTACLGTSNIKPAIHCSVFLCFRVLLLRMPATDMAPLWSLMVSEMIQIFSDLEKELLDDDKKCSYLLKKASDSNGSSLSSDLSCKNGPQHLAVFLSVCKLLDLCLALPAARLPQSMLYMWGFVSEEFETGRSAFLTNGNKAEEAREASTVEFLPYVVRVAKRILARFGRVKPLEFRKGQLQLTMTAIDSLRDLAPFLASVCENVTRQQARNFDVELSGGRRRLGSTSGHGQDGEMSANDEVDIISLIEQDFLEPLTK